jgi:CRP/FNR family transcriptional regulator, cyclic AMP receptor protein
VRVKPDDIAANTALANATADDRAELAALCSVQTVRRGEYLLRRGDEPRGLGLLLEGTARIIWQIGDRRPVLIQGTGPHDGFIGLREVLADRARTISVVTLTACRLAVLPTTSALALFERRPHLLWPGVQELCIGLNRFAQFAADIGVLDLPRQVAKLLLEPTDAPPRRRESQDDLASRLGASRQSVNKALTMLHVRGWIERCDDGTLAVRQPDAMRRYVDGPPRLRRPRHRGTQRDVTDADWQRCGPVLRSLGDAETTRLRELGRIVTYRLGDMVLAEREQLDHVTVVLNGQGLLTSDSGTHGTYVHRSIEPDGSLLGASALFRDEPPTVSVRAQEPMRVLEIPREPFAAALRRSPQALRLVGGEIADDVTAHLRTTAELATLNATGRVASVLLHHSDAEGGVHLLLTQRQLAARVGLSRQSVNRALTELRDDKIIEADHGIYHVRDLSSLHRLVYDSDE